MIRTKQILTVGKIAAVMAWLVPLAIWASAKDKIASAPSTKAMRLVLSPQTRLQLPVAPIGNDSVEAKVIVTVADSCKNQRHLCRLETSAPVQIFTEPRYQWALRGDTLMVLSAVPLRVRLSRQSFTSTNSAPVKLRIHYQNLDHAARLAGTAVADLVPAETTLSANPVKLDSAAAAAPPLDNPQSAQAPSSTISPSGRDSTATGTATRGRAFGLIYVAIAVLLILLFSVLSWLMTRSQRRRFQKVGAKSAAISFPRFEKMQPPAPAVAKDAVATHNDAAKVATAEPQKHLVAASSSHSDLPAVVSDNGHDVSSLASLLAQLHELNAGLQQVIANQAEANRRLAEMMAATKLSLPPSATQLSLFDILNDDPASNHGERSTNGNAAAPQLRIQFASESRNDGLSVNLASSSPVHIELFANDRRADSLSVNLVPSSKLRLLFANTENNSGGAGDDPGNARLLDSSVSATKHDADEIK